jgi:hypothetical protein
MINRKDIEQGSLEWHQIKWGKIGGTLSKGLLVNSDTLLIDILSQRMEEFEPVDSFTNEHMERGNELEPFARLYLNEYTGLTFNQTGWLQSEENELLGISPDGITEDEKSSCEIKCFARKKHYEILLDNEIPLENIFQCIHYFTVNPKLEQHYFISFRPEAPKHFVKKLDRNSQVNIGTKARPVILIIEEAVKKIKSKSDDLLKIIIEKEQELLF